MKKLAQLCCSLFLVIACGGCSHAIDAAATKRTEKIMQGDLIFYPDSNVLVYKSDIGLKRDGEKARPKLFYIKLPKGLLSYQAANSETFCFYYPNNQIIAIYIDLFHKHGHDTLFSVLQPEIENYRRNFMYHKGSKYNLWNVEESKGRNSYMMKKGQAEILLYNLKPGNSEAFLANAHTFTFL